MKSFNYKKEDDLALVLQLLIKGEIKLTKFHPQKQKLIEEFEEVFWDFDVEKYDALYQVYLDRDVTISRRGTPKKVQGNYVIKFVAWKDDEGNEEITDEYPELIRCLRYDANKLAGVRDKLREELGYEPDVSGV